MELFVYLMPAFLLFVTFKDAVHRLTVHLLGDEAHDSDNGEAAHHGNGTTVNRVDGIS